MFAVRAQSQCLNLAAKTARCFSEGARSWKVSSLGKKLLLAGSVAFTGVTLTTAGTTLWPFVQSAHAGSTVRPDITPSRRVYLETDSSGLKLTLFQFQTCPFCCKVRALLDYYGYSYDIVEVNSVTKKQIKWSNYKKVPIVLIDGVGENGFLQLNESSVIVSVLESWRQDQRESLEKLLQCYVCIESEERGKKVYEFPNKYFIMFMDKTNLPTTPEERQEERKWRKWTDDHLVHMLSPNVYRTLSEALQAFNYFSEVGDWEKNFSTIERFVVIYTGAAVMYLLGKMLKKKYNLKEDVRESLYEACKEWTKAIGKKRAFMGGDQPNLADLAVYGVLNSIEGCPAFQDAKDNTNIGTWYKRMQIAVKSHAGAHPLKESTVTSSR